MSIGIVTIIAGIASLDLGINEDERDICLFGILNLVMGFAFFFGTVIRYTLQFVQLCG